VLYIFLKLLGPALRGMLGKDALLRERPDALKLVMGRISEVLNDVFRADRY
jgi:hypothetical protein